MVFAATGTATADWDINDEHKMHYPQLPDLDEGMNVLAQEPKVIADDFMCTASGRIRDIHIWGSWLFDEFPEDPDGTGNPSPGNTGFHLSIHEDVPKSATNDYSHPGDELWARDFWPGQFSHQFWANSYDERFFDPNINQVIGFDNTVWQYNFVIPKSEAYFQEEGTIYWLDVMAIPLDPINPTGLFGWKTSRDHWMDDSVYGDMGAAGGQVTDWYELWDPDYEFSLDQAFVITPEPATISLLCIGGLALLRRRRR